MFYNKFYNLCKENGKTPASVARDVGFSRSIITKWKTDGSSPNMTTLVKLAEYFGVSTDYFRDEPIIIDTGVVSNVINKELEKKEKPPIMDGRVFELVTLCNQLTNENLLKAADYIRYLISTQE